MKSTEISIGDCFTYLSIPDSKTYGFICSKKYNVEKLKIVEFIGVGFDKDNIIDIDSFKKNGFVKSNEIFSGRTLSMINGVQTISMDINFEIIGSFKHVGKITKDIIIGGGGDAFDTKTFNRYLVTLNYDTDEFKRRKLEEFLM